MLQIKEGFDELLINEQSISQSSIDQGPNLIAQRASGAFSESTGDPVLIPLNLLENPIQIGTQYLRGNIPS
jgi:hypothetical protein